MTSKLKFLAAAGIALAAFSGAASAHGGVSLGLSIGLPAPVYVAPQPYYAPPVVVAPAPVYATPYAYGGYYGPGYYGRGYYGPHYYNDHRHWH